jgi:hypothetical protein
MMALKRLVSFVYAKERGVLKKDNRHAMVP